MAVLRGKHIDYIYTNHLEHTPRVITDSTNKVIWRWDSDPFRTTPANEDPDNNGVKFTYNLRFPGQYFNKELEISTFPSDEDLCSAVDTLFKIKLIFPILFYLSHAGIA